MEDIRLGLRYLRNGWMTDHNRFLHILHPVVISYRDLLSACAGAYPLKSHRASKGKSQQIRLRGSKPNLTPDVLAGCR
jgi:hypothetical protein